MAQVQWTKLIRFVGSDGKVHSGDALVSRRQTDPRKSQHARIIHGNPFGNYSYGPAVEVVRLLPPIPYSKIRTVRCLGLNYAKHAKEAGMPLPTDPIVFHKPATAITGPSDAIPVSELYQTPFLDYEVELVVVIGRECYNVSPKEALKYVAGYTVGNDVSHRDWQIGHGSQWTLGKSHDGFAPIGPAIVRGVDPANLRISCRVNGQQRQDSNTSDMVFSVAEAISILSKTATLMPGDLLFMGTPEGVGMGMQPPQYLQNGDVVECEIAGIGSIRNVVRHVDARTRKSSSSKKSKPLKSRI